MPAAPATSRPPAANRLSIVPLLPVLARAIPSRRGESPAPRHGGVTDTALEIDKGGSVGDSLGCGVVVGVGAGVVSVGVGVGAGVVTVGVGVGAGVVTEGVGVGIHVGAGLLSDRSLPFSVETVLLAWTEAAGSSAAADGAVAREPVRANPAVRLQMVVTRRVPVRRLVCMRQRLTPCFGLHNRSELK